MSVISFCKSFDIKEFERIQIQEFFKAASAFVLKTKKGNLPLAQVVLNFYKPNPIFQNISGAISLSILSNSKMNVMLIADRHNSRWDVNCSNDTPINLFLKKITETQPFFFDLFYESIYNKDILPEFALRGSSLLHAVGTTFKKCFVPTLREGFYNTRCHSADMRGLLSEIVLRNNIKKKLPKTNPFYKFLTYKSADATLHIMEFLNKTNITINDYIQLETIILNEIPVVKKQLTQTWILEGVIRQAWKTYVVCELTKMKKFYNSNIVNQTQANFKISINIIRNILVTAPILDVYILGRMFRSFKRENYQPAKMSNVIIVAGYKHIQLYYSILEKRGFKLKYNTLETGNDKCLVVNKFNYRKIVLN
jgi:hypothetical protein